MQNAAPNIIYDGFDDQSRRPPVRETETVAVHTPLLHLFTETGPTEATLVNSASGGFNAIFGSKSLERRGKFFNLQSLLAETLLGQANPFYVKRLRPTDAANPARLVVAIDMVPDLIPKVTTALSGFDYPDQVNDTDIIDSTGEVEKVMGIRARIVLIDNNSVDQGSLQPMPGSFVSENDGTQSTVYPLFEMPATFFGSGGNLLGIRLWAPTVDDALVVDESAAAEFKTRMYRMQVMRRLSATTTPTIVRTAASEEYVDISFTEGTYSESTDKEYYAGTVLAEAYSDDGYSSGLSPLYAPFEGIHIYHDNLLTVQEIIYDAELDVNPAAATHISDPGQIDVFTGIDYQGDRHHALLLEGPLKGGIRLGKENTIYAQGGTDGTTDLAMYEELVVRECQNFGELEDQYENVPVYKFGFLYDTGLTMDGKYAMMAALPKRKDLIIRFTTYVESEGRYPTPSEELSRTQAIMSRLRAYPESTLYGTPVCRAEIIQQTGKLALGGYTKPVPQVLDYAKRWAIYGGAGTGILRTGFAVDTKENNRIDLIKNLNVKFFNGRVRADLWSNGATYSLSYDRKAQYYPAIHSVYSDDTSVLISPITTAICTDIVRLIYTVHADFSGNAELTREQLIERCDNRILELVDGKYGDRVRIIPETYFTDADDQRGFSWHCKVTVHANNPHNVMIFDLETRRMSDLDQE